MNSTAGFAGPYDGTGLDVLVAATATPSSSAAIGDRGRLRSLVRWCAQTGMSYDALQALDTDVEQLDPATASRLADQLRRAGQVLRGLPVPALGWDVAGTAGLHGAVLGADLSTEHGSLIFSTGTVDIYGRVADAQAWFEVRGDEQTARFTTWTVQGADVTLDGSPAPEWAQEAVRALGAAAGSVHAVHPTTAVAPLLTTAHEMATAAASAGEPLRVASAGHTATVWPG